MDLKNTINNTNTQKENIKTVANNIDNKLVELGGEQATDLSDVPNKIGAMVGQYKHFAQGNSNLDFKIGRSAAMENGVLVQQNNGNSDYDIYKFKTEKRIEIPLNLDFEPKIIFITFNTAGFDLDSSKLLITLNSEEHYVKNNSDLLENKVSTTTTPHYYDMVRMFVEELNSDKVIINVYFCKSDFSNSFGSYPLFIKGCRWIAIG